MLSVSFLPLVTVETEGNGDSKSTNEWDPSLVGSMGLPCCTRDCCPALATLVGPSTKYFFFLIAHYFTSFVPFAQQAVQAVVLGSLASYMCLWLMPPDPCLMMRIYTLFGQKIWPLNKKMFKRIPDASFLLLNRETLARNRFQVLFKF